MLTEVRHTLRRLRATPVVTLSAIACVTAMIIEHGLRITLSSVCIGSAVSIGVMKVLGAIIVDVSMSYPAAIGGVIGLVVLLSFIASAIPALRAGRLNPVEALRAE